MEPHGQAPFLPEQDDQAQATELLLAVIRWLVFFWLTQVPG